MLFKEKQLLFACKSHVKHINIMCVKNAKFLNVKECETQSN
jgi:hypothetical protein